MKFTDKEKEKLSGPKLRKYCYKTDNKYLCKIKIGSWVKTLNKHDTIEACNAQYDQAMEEYANHTVTNNQLHI